MKRLLTTFLSIVAVACSSTDTSYWVSMDTTPRTKKLPAYVELLDEEPTRQFKVIGLIAPPADQYESYAQMINDIRKIAADKGADAVFVVSEDRSRGWSFSGGGFGASGGTTEITAVRAKAIVWR